MNRFYTMYGYILSKFLNFLPSFRLVSFILNLLPKNKIGKNVTIHNNVRFVIPKNLILANNVTINSQSFIDSRKGIKINENTMIGRNCSLYTLTHNVDSPDFISEGASIVIGKNVVVFPSSIILPGITIGDGAVIYPGSVVSRDVSPYTKVAGVPAKVVGTRNKEIDYKINYKMYWGV